MSYCQSCADLLRERDTAQARVRALVAALEEVRRVGFDEDEPCCLQVASHILEAAPDDAACVARERAREAVVEAAPRVLSWLDEIVHLDRVPRACGACGTPNASCDMDCANAAYMSRDTCALRTALAALATAPASTPATDQ